MLPLYLLTTLLSAALLFTVEPMVAKMLLPLLGGSPAVWNTCMMFYQAVLLAGYAYAHLLTRRLAPRTQAVAHAKECAIEVPPDSDGGTTSPLGARCIDRCRDGEVEVLAQAVELRVDLRQAGAALENDPAASLVPRTDRLSGEDFRVAHDRNTKTSRIVGSPISGTTRPRPAVARFVLATVQERDPIPDLAHEADPVHAAPRWEVGILDRSAPMAYLSTCVS